MARLADRVRGVPPHLSYAVLAVTSWERPATPRHRLVPCDDRPGPGDGTAHRDVARRPRHPPRHPEWPYFPPDLRDLGPIPASPTQINEALAEIARHVKSLDRTAGDGRGSAARDWRRWDERMNWAMTLMRSRQQDETVFWRPYSTRDVERIRAASSRCGRPTRVPARCSHRSVSACCRRSRNRREADESHDPPRRRARRAPHHRRL